MSILVRVALNGLGLWLAAQVLPGVHYSGGLWSLLGAGCVIGLINLLVRPLVTLLLGTDGISGAYFLVSTIIQMDCYLTDFTKVTSITVTHSPSGRTTH